MNTICNIQPKAGGWRVEAQAPGGALVVVCRPGSLDEALDAARRAEPEPA